ncbi:octaprenyl diphosphate synthase [Solemya velum gill symbiont]|uniref:Octaprenyl diphosphate synthase n=1 Tax=Solemya velum gill symbiont TaxID=2340 RepID=A0A0B0HBA9_SOVGS|nr:octaprenyl diphosphate synthase [Solemya velum gill symbiont]KHF25169.1 geranylgeranyl pyrophosphate synthase [Solemya velum gill symbiont]OOY34894.1 octaprenyl diphosphate synthase [Solemya velum gill symbiont]OOY37604.1 octaprenyl diphosphate synthase [Solemya velum gill symbiont]OOY40647.1 octaprenyl diphosphate synthase [Solemya velum gill symbiont]OOY42836.1 octaprenyl diphosphate synthase [Solemya velum gill symbiont]
MTVETARTLVSRDLHLVDDLILLQLYSDVTLINQIGQYIVNSGGKRLRPLLVLLAAKAVGYEGAKHLDIAAIIEFIHTATLLHDDVVDSSDQRRDRDTANHVWGNPASVLVGDFLYSRAFEMMVSVGEMRVMDVLSHATNQIAEGEVLQLLNCNDPDISEEQYIDVIVRKTATLFEAGTRLAAVITQSDSNIESALANYGMQLGIAFQIIDDALDYSGQDIGKNIGDDLEEGKPTLPLLRAMESGNPKSRNLIRSAIEEGGRDKIERVMAAINQSDAIEYTTNRAKEHAEKAKQALGALPASEYRDALSDLADFAVARAF